jgi:hypothetical protein
MRGLAEKISKKLWKGDKVRFAPDQAFIEDIVSLLVFLERHQQIDRYLPRFRGKYTQVNGALAEVRISFFLEKIGFTIIEWEPLGAGNHEGEFIVQLENSPKIFIEVKAPTWESELTQEEKIGLRKNQTKYLSREARFVNPVSLIKKAICKAVPKFKDDEMNILAIGGYLSFLSPFEIPKDIFIPQINHDLSIMDIGKLSGIFILDFGNWGDGIKYQSFYLKNPSVKPISSLPEGVEAKLSVYNQEAFSR